MLKLMLVPLLVPLLMPTCTADLFMPHPNDLTALEDIRLEEIRKYINQNNIKVKGVAH